MNRVIISKRVNVKWLVYSNPCPLSTNETELFVGNYKTCAEGKYKYFRKLLTNKESKPCVHCTFAPYNKFNQ